ncbi:glycosyltransferase [Haloarcula litorea]|uniref:glycosyltransferase n=1 Tax=Haloarcula litorea TaxID=3032579 RepID=UPI0023E85E5D|nr:glycosyltransferase [Halomicroarcula sp. GDY20]
MADGIGVVVPAYDPDPTTLVPYLDDLHSVVDPTRVHVELDDPDSDALVERLRETGSTVNCATARRGKGAALTAGFDRLDTARLAFADADGSVPADSLADVVRGLDEAAVSVGSRRHPDATVVSSQSTFRELLGDGFAWAARRTLAPSLYDYQCGAKAVDAGTWDSVRDHLTETGFAWDIELVAVADALGHDIAEVPVTWRDHAESTVDPIATPVELGRTLVELRVDTAGLGPTVTEDHPSGASATDGQS